MCKLTNSCIHVSWNQDYSIIRSNFPSKPWWCYWYWDVEEIRGKRKRKYMHVQDKVVLVMNNTEELRAIWVEYHSRNENSWIRTNTGWITLLEPWRDWGLRSRSLSRSGVTSFDDLVLQELGPLAVHGSSPCSHNHYGRSDGWLELSEMDRNSNRMHHAIIIKYHPNVHHRDMMTDSMTVSEDRECWTLPPSPPPWTDISSWFWRTSKQA
jgi:hypothetical protein